MKTLSCNAAYAVGGVGLHYAQLIEEVREEGELERYYAPALRDGDDQGEVVPKRALPLLARYTPVRFSPAWTNYLDGELFDRAVARRLKPPIDVFVGFVGKSLHSFRRARQLGARRLELMTLNTHVNDVKRQHQRAIDDWGIESGWMHEPQMRKTIQEYEMADVLRIHSNYVKESLVRWGVPESKMTRYVLIPHPRFVPPEKKLDDGVFRVVYVGRLSIDKGICVLIEAFSRIKAPRAELRLVGGWSTRGMRKYLQEWMRRDPRIVVSPGDPLPHLHRADVYVQPAYEDGFPYAVQEAMKCDVPVVVTEDTGTKELVRNGRNGFIIPTGDWPALLNRLEYLRMHPLRPSTSLRPSATLA